MKVQYRRFWWAFCYILSLVLVASVAGYLGRNLTGLGPIPVRSAFAGRLPSIQEGDKRRFQFFYATNRENSEETFNERGNQLGNSLLVGTFDALITPGLFIKPYVWLDSSSMKIADHKALAEEAFRSQLRTAVQNSPHKSLLVVVWGYRDWFRSAAIKTAYTAYVLDINTPVLMFDWPGNQGDSPIGYRAAQRIATLSAPDLGRILSEVIRETGTENLWIMGSSLGCQTICDSFAWLANQPGLFENKPKIAQVILSAPDVSAQAFDEKFAERIQQSARHLTAYVSSNDRALLMSQWLNRGRRLGRTAQAALPPSARNEQYEFEEGQELLELRAKGARSIDVVDATPINRLRNLHHFFTDSPEFFDDLYQRFLQPDHMINRRLHSLQTAPEGETYWILWNM